MKRLRIAIPKGRLQDATLALFAAAGYSTPTPLELLSRRLLFERPDIEWILVKDADVPVYVENGVAAAGVSGLDQLLEQEPDVYEPVELDFGRCALWLIAAEGARPIGSTARIATKYPNVAEAFARSRGIAAEVVALHGSVELAAVLGLTPYVIDLVETGETLRANDLQAVEMITPIAPRLIINKASWRLDGEGVRELVTRVAAAVEVTA